MQVQKIRKIKEILVVEEMWSRAQCITEVHPFSPEAWLRLQRTGEQTERRVESDFLSHVVSQYCFLQRK